MARSDTACCPRSGAAASRASRGPRAAAKYEESSTEPAYGSSPASSIAWAPPCAGGSCRELGRNADRQPPDPLPEVLRCMGELAFDRLSPLSKVLPPLVVDRDDCARLNQPAQLYGLPGGHRVVHGARDREAHAAQVQERGADLQAVGDLAHAVVEHRVARDPEDAVLLPVPLKREPDHIADDRAAQRGSMAAGRGGDLDRRPSWRL